ncbi:MAG: hypothetical protein JWO96_845 [Candidatus Saccharibacteria bacterium]|nr:hypothetical protein [Candidatus Saccharibacteria bacterium]
MVKVFYKCINNGVVAIVDEAIYNLIEEYGRLPENLRAVTLYPTPIFTFVEADFLDHTTYHGYVTGSTELMDALLRNAIVVERNFYVPFSNCSHINGDTAELRYRTTLDDAVGAFGLLEALLPV